MSSPSRPALLALLVVASLGVVLLGAAGGGVAQTDATESAAPNTTMVVDLESDGDANWTISTTFELESDEEIEAYRDLADSFEAGTEPALGLATFEQAADRVTLEEGRSMAITDVERSTASDEQVANGTGRLTVSFTWENFARIDDDEMHVDDVLTTENGVWFSGLDTNETLLMRPPDGYGVLSASVDEGFASIVGDGSIQWTGPATFNDQSLQTSFIGNDGTTRPPPADGSSSLVWFLGGAILLITGAFAAYVAWQRDLLPDSDKEPAATGGRANADTGGAPDTDGGADTAAAADDSGVNEALLSDEERVMHLLEENGGRMKQADIVKETDWSNAKVSQLLSAMENDGEINKLRIGRENLISFPDEDIADPDEQ